MNIKNNDLMGLSAYSMNSNNKLSNASMLKYKNVDEYTNFESQIPVLESVQLDYLYLPTSISKIAVIVKNEFGASKSTISALSTDMNDSTTDMKEAIYRMTHQIDYHNKHTYNKHWRYKKY